MNSKWTMVLKSPVLCPQSISDGEMETYQELAVSLLKEFWEAPIFAWSTTIIIIDLFWTMYTFHFDYYYSRSYFIMLLLMNIHEHSHSCSLLYTLLLIRFFDSVLGQKSNCCWIWCWGEIPVYSLRREVCLFSVTRHQSLQMER